MEITAYRLRRDVCWPLRPAALHRAWMDAFPMRWPYRCLPLTMANQAGWEVLCPVPFEAVWSGGDGPEALQLRFERDPEIWAHMIGSHFGGGVLTFTVPYLFRTPEPVGLFVRGACNHWVEGASPLDAWVETWASEAPFTMNWKVVAVGAPVRFHEGEPICLIQPFELGHLEEARPAVRDLEDDPELAARYEAWRRARFSFEATREAGDSQLSYRRGVDAQGRPLPAHRTRIDVPAFPPPATDRAGTS